jgi:transcriptional regulator with XRE-family HTH domain
MYNTRKKSDRHLSALGNAIKSCREALGISQQEFAEQIKAPLRFVERLEDGEEEPRIFVLMACAKVFDLSVSELLEIARFEREAALVCIEEDDVRVSSRPK